VSGRRRRIGVIAPELSAAAGGMQEFARQIGGVLAPEFDVTVYARPGAAAPSGAYRVEAALEGDVRDIEARLRCEDVDAWFACNAGLGVLASGLPQPFVLYVNGNDILQPWVGVPTTLADALGRTPGLWRIAEPLRRITRRRALRRGLRDCALIIANSTYVRGLVLAEAPELASRVMVIPPGLDDAYFTARPSTSSGAFHLLTVARLSSTTPRKNVDGVLRAVALAPPDWDLRYRVVGDGDDRERLVAYARELGVDDRTEFVGGVSRAEVIRSYARADLFVLAAHASRYDVEGFGMVYLEASAAGTPVLASRSGGATDAVREGVNGLLVEDGSPEAILAGIRRLREAPGGFPPDAVREVARPYRWSVLGERYREAIRGAVG
jgi:glycosyltransferase involved in cell wall biosynthesis